MIMARMAMAIARMAMNNGNKIMASMANRNGQNGNNKGIIMARMAMLMVIMGQC